MTEFGCGERAQRKVNAQVRMEAGLKFSFAGGKERCHGARCCKNHAHSIYLPVTNNWAVSEWAKTARQFSKERSVLVLPGITSWKQQF